jgi:hypothetical protein
MRAPAPRPAAGSSSVPPASAPGSSVTSVPGAADPDGAASGVLLEAAVLSSVGSSVGSAAGEVGCTSSWGAGTGAPGPRAVPAVVPGRLRVTTSASPTDSRASASTSP